MPLTLDSAAVLLVVSFALLPETYPPTLLAFKAAGVSFPFSLSFLNERALTSNVSQPSAAAPARRPTSPRSSSPGARLRSRTTFA